MSHKTKHWKVGTKDGKSVIFVPHWEIKKEIEQGQKAQVDDKDIECTAVEFRITGAKGKEETLVMNFQDLFMFVYFIANEELRQQLALRYERHVNYIPYDVTFTLDKEEMQRGSCKRRIELPVDEIAMAIARNEAMKLKNPLTGQFKDWLFKGKK